MAESLLPELTLDHLLLTDELLAISNTVRRFVQLGLRAAGVTYEQYDILREIDRLGGISIVELARHLQVDPSTASRNLDLLVRRGVLTRRRTVLDARGRQIFLTLRGRELATACRQRVLAVLGDQFRGMDAGRILAVLANCRRVLGSGVR